MLLAVCACQSVTDKKTRYENDNYSTEIKTDWVHLLQVPDRFRTPSTLTPHPPRSHPHPAFYGWSFIGV